MCTLIPVLIGCYLFRRGLMASLAACTDTRGLEFVTSRGVLVVAGTSRLHRRRHVLLSTTSCMDDCDEFYLQLGMWIPSKVG